MSGSNRDLRHLEENEAVYDAFAALVSGGKPGYKTVIEKKKIPPKCSNCGRGGDEGQKFCPQCGGKMIIPLTNCPNCKRRVDETEKFCIECGTKLKD